MKKIFISFIVIGLCVSNLSGYIYQLHVLKKINPKTKRMQCVIACGDYHDKTHAQTSSQKLYLQNILNKTRRCWTVLVEDLSSLNTENRYGCGPYKINARDGLLGAFQEGIKNRLVQTKNLEYRYCRVAALCPLMNQSPLAQNCKSCLPLTVGNIYDELLHEVEIIKNYSDSKYLHQIYKRIVTDVYAKSLKFQFAKYKNNTITQFCKKDKNMLNNLCTFDSQILDAKIMHEIYNSDRECVFVLAGGTHTKHVAQLLQSIGYTLEYQTIGKMAATVSTSLSTNIGTKKSIPSAIDLKVLEKYIK